MTSEKGIVNWYYSSTVPARSVAVAKVTAPVLTPSQLTSINNTVYNRGTLGVWRSSSSLSSPADFTSPGLGISTPISGVEIYYVGNQFFELTNRLAADGITPLYYQHQLPSGATHIQILDLNGNQINTTTLWDTGTSILYHSLDGAAYRIQYLNGGYPEVCILSYIHTIPLATSLPINPNTYNLTGNILTLYDAGTYYFRFTQNNGYQVMPTYTYLPNTPWYPRVRFGLTLPPVDWAQQMFYPSAPYLPATFIAGKVLDDHMIQFERGNIHSDPSHYPDILVFDSNNNIKYALDGYIQTGGNTDDTPYLKGYVYNWQREQIISMDPTNARVDVAVELDPTDIVWGFYTYAEQDFIYTGFDCNPFTNTLAGNNILQLYVKFSEGYPSQNIYHQLLDPAGNVILGQTNDPNPGEGSPVIFAQIAVGSSVSKADMSFTDSRVNGGGLAEQYISTTPQSVNFFDCGFWDGKPYPFAGALAIYVPAAILLVLSRSEIQGRVASALPVGTMVVLRYFDPATGMETV